MDVDTGVDDALALLLALSSPEVELVGVSTVAGNVPLQRTTDNTLRLLQWAERADIPVYAGAEQPLVRDAIAAADVHGATGLGAAHLPEPCTAPAGDAVEFLLSTLQAHPGEVTLVATGPLTNLAQAEARVPGVLGRARQVVTMGGAVRVPAMSHQRLSSTSTPIRTQRAKSSRPRPSWCWWGWMSPSRSD